MPAARFCKDLADTFSEFDFNQRMSFSVEHLGLPARDPNALQEWYRRVLGATLIYDNGAVPQAFFIELDGGMMLEIFEAYFSLKETGDNRLAGWRHLALRVDSIEKSRVELESKGVVFTETVKPAGGGGNVLFFSDPEGNLLHLVERPANSVFDR